MDKMGRAGVSSDESDSEAGSSKHSANAFWIISPTWRSPQLATFLRGLDPIVIVQTQPRVGERKRRGQPPRLRKLPDPERFNDSVLAPPGLPRNCYNNEWYDKLPQWAKNQVSATDEDYNFLGVEQEAQ
jgi:hypothetical protein